MSYGLTRCVGLNSMMCLVQKQHTSSKDQHIYCEAWWCQHHAFGNCFSSAVTGALVKMEGIITSFKYQEILAPPLES